MQSNVGIQNNGTISWDGTTSYPRDIRKYTRFGWVFETTAALAADAVFNVEAAPPSAADPCVPGAFVPVPEVSICDRPAVAGPQATVRIPAGTLAGVECAGTIPCRPDAFVRLTPVSGPTADVRAVLIRNGPMI